MEAAAARVALGAAAIKVEANTDPAAPVIAIPQRISSVHVERDEGLTGCDGGYRRGGGNRARHVRSRFVVFSLPVARTGVVDSRRETEDEGRKEGKKRRVKVIASFLSLNFAKNVLLRRTTSRFSLLDSLARRFTSTGMHYIATQARESLFSVVARTLRLCR